MYSRYFKPIFDTFLALVILVLLAPLILFILVLLYFSNGGSPIFIQKRPGKNNKIFALIKFRTMNEKRYQTGELLPDNKRLTSIGKFIRKTSLDELPQLINVVKGDMSIVGPRPLLIEYLVLYSPIQARRHEVKPGITGWAQINGRNAISWREKFEYDVWYVDNISLHLDIKIAILTFVKVLKSEGVNSSIDVTMEAFTGNN
jgi:lipopolysaccharide/colanic/teichoic acid biosynthesis glycosyltransferase